MKLYRQEKFNTAIFNALSLSLFKIKMLESSLKGITMIRVETNKKLNFAKIYYCTDNFETEDTNLLIPFFKKEIATRLNLKFVPYLKLYKKEKNFTIDI